MTTTNLHWELHAAAERERWLAGQLDAALQRLGEYEALAARLQANLPALLRERAELLRRIEYLEER